VDREIPHYKAFVGYESTVPLDDSATEVMIRVEAQDAHGNVGARQKEQPRRRAGVLLHY